MQFSLRDLMIVVAFWAAIAWCASQVGLDNQMFWFVVGVSAFIFVLFIYLARDERRPRRALWVTVPVLVFSFLMVSITLFVYSALLTIAAIFLARRPPPRIRTLARVCMAAVLISLAGGVIPGIFEARRMETMRRDFPIVSLERRLRYEKHRAAPVSRRDPITNVSAMVRLNDLENDLDMRTYRRNQFKNLHDHQYELFVRSVGFGVGRMMPITRRLTRPPVLRDIRFDEITSDSSQTEPNDWRDVPPAGKSNTVEDLHKVSRDDFLNPSFWGAVIVPPLNVSGFLEHGFHYAPEGSLKDAATWTIERLELVSLLRFAEPRVYILDHLPRMDQLSSDNAPTRSLDAFESKALAQLWTTEDIVVDHKGNEYRMMGSLRAAKQCLECHSVERGELLGAFSYSLRHKASADGGNRVAR